MNMENMLPLTGMTDAEIDALEAEGVIAQRESATERES